MEKATIQQRMKECHEQWLEYVKSELDLAVEKKGEDCVEAQILRRVIADMQKESNLKLASMAKVD